MELFQFQEAKLVSPGVYNLSVRLRGQLGTEADMPRIEAVRALVYDAVGPRPEAVTLVVAPPDLAPPLMTVLPPSAMQVSTRCALVGDAKALDRRLLAAQLPAGAVPKWVALALADKSLRSEFAVLTRLTRQALERLPEDPNKRLLLRLIILHHWRRLVLRQSPLADALLPAEWEGAQARAAVIEALERLPRIAPDALNLALQSKG